MKRVLFLALALAAVSGLATDVRFTFEDSTQAPQGTRGMLLYNLNTPRLYNGVQVTRDRISVNTDMLGGVTVSNLIGGDYRAEFAGTFTRTTNWYSFPDTNGLINAADCLSTPTNAVGGILVYSTAAVDAKLAAVTNGVARLSDLAAATNGLPAPNQIVTNGASPAFEAVAGNSLTLQDDSVQGTPFSLSLIGALGGSPPVLVTNVLQLDDSGAFGFSQALLVKPTPIADLPSPASPGVMIIGGSTQAASGFHPSIYFLDAMGGGSGILYWDGGNFVIGGGGLSLPGNILTAGSISTGGAITNCGVVWLVTNNVPAAYPNGSLCTRTDTGQLYVRTGGAWVAK